MTDDEARIWLRERYGPEPLELLSAFVAMVVDENKRQNLISPASALRIWTRHVLDSAQLVRLAPAKGTWLDIGTGGGFPGIVVALLRPEPTMLIEPRRRRADFLWDCAARLGLTKRVEVIDARVETVAVLAEVISARAVASVEKLLQCALQCAKNDTRWLLPRGTFTESDLRQLRRGWSGLFHVEQSMTDDRSSILVLEQVSRR